MMRVDSLLVAEDAPGTRRSRSSSFGVLVGELFLLEVDQLAERHPEDRVGLDGRERVLLGDAALFLELGEAVVAEGPLHAARRAS